ncbi:hypothetical protein [Actinomadura decatromicini]|uniref:Uncharacterized protein n=1 Tax=Actinomadura decatromicini TaxID=2604572 RepID=A0A5D3F9D2_9ACTN|nr:hypothetical protein [Actinomadura decatromicini]TYK44514.1 hypothetical protein FXF68_34175 [Actinomadura decatromicini]
MRVVEGTMAALEHQSRGSRALLAAAALLAALLAAFLGFGAAAAFSGGHATGRHTTILAGDGTAMGVGRT